MLAGGRETIARERPCLLMEIEERHNPGGLSRIDKSLSDLGTKGSILSVASVVLSERSTMPAINRRRSPSKPGTKRRPS